MKFSLPPQSYTKLCHAKPGMVVMLVDSQMQLDQEPYLVCAVADKHKRAARVNAPHGLYDDERQLFLVSLSTGQTKDMPNLSSRAIMFPEANLQLGAEFPKDALANVAALAKESLVGKI